MPGFDWKQLLDLAPLAVSAMKPGSPEAAAVMRGYQRSQEQQRQRTLQEHQIAGQDELRQAQLRNLEQDNARQAEAQTFSEEQARINRLLQAVTALQPTVTNAAETAPDATAAENQVFQRAQGLESGLGLKPSSLSSFVPPMAPMVSAAKKRRAKARYQEFLSAYKDRASEAEGSLTESTGEFAGMTMRQVRDLAEAVAPPPKAPPTPGSMEEFASETDSAKKAVMLANRRAFMQADDRGPVQLNPGQEADREDQAQQLVDGNLVPSMMSKRSADFNDILSRANRKSKEQTGQPINFVKLQTQFAAAQRFAASQNSSQATRFRSLAGSVVNTINEVKNLADDLKQGGVQLWNRARRGSVLQVYGNTPQSETAAQYLAAVNTLKEEFAGLIQGGYAPTESAFALANQQINGDYGVKDLNAAITEVQRLINYRLSAFEGLQPLGASPTSPASTLLPPGVTVTRVK